MTAAVRPTPDDPFADLVAAGHGRRIRRNVGTAALADPAGEDPFADLIPDDPFADLIPRNGLDPRLTRGVRPDASRALPPQQARDAADIKRARDLEGVQGAAANAVQGATLGLARHALPESFGENVDRFRETNPALAMGAGFAGGVAVPGAGLLKAYKALRPASTAGRIGLGVTGGAVAGGIEGAAEADEGQRGTGALVGGTLGGLLAGGVAAAPLIRPVAAQAGRAVVRPLGIVSNAAREANTDKVIAKAIARAGMRAEDVQAALNGGASMVEALGPAADDVLRSLAGLSDDAAGALAKAGRETADKPLARRLVAASKRKEKEGLAGPLLNLALGRHAGPVKALAKLPSAGLSRAARQEADHTARTLLTRVKQSKATAGHSTPTASGGPWAQRGATRAQLQHRETLFGLPRVTPDPPQGASLGPVGQEDLVSLLARSIAESQAGNRVGSLRPR